MEYNSHYNSSISDCRIIDLPRITHTDGSIAVAQNSDAIPFAIKRTFFIYDIPSDAVRGGHSHHSGKQLIIAASGSFAVKVFDGAEWREFTLDRPYRALYVPAGIWRSLENFSSGSICLTLCPDKFDETDYVRSMDTFMELTKHKR